MDTLWSCVLVIIILCFIGILVWLLWKRALPSKKFKGGGIKMKGGVIVPELTSAFLNQALNDREAIIRVSMWNSAIERGLGIDGYSPDNAPQAFIDSAIVAALIAQAARATLSSTQAFAAQNPQAFVAQNPQAALVAQVFAAQNPQAAQAAQESVAQAARDFVAQVFAAQNPQAFVAQVFAAQAARDFVARAANGILRSIFSSCMKGPNAVACATLLSRFHSLFDTFYDDEHVQNDYTAIIYRLITNPDARLYTYDIQLGGNAIRYFTNAIIISGTDFNNIITNFIENIDGVISNLPTNNKLPIYMKTLVSCILYIANHMEQVDQARASFLQQGALGIYNAATDSPIKWLLADQVCDIDGFILPPGIVTADIIGNLERDYSGYVDFEYIANYVSDAGRNAIFEAQVQVICDINTTDPNLTYKIASNIVMPAT